jgi:hypothetical protein
VWAVSPGKADVVAYVGNIKASPWTVTISAPVVAAVQPAASAAVQPAVSAPAAARVAEPAAAAPSETAAPAAGGAAPATPAAPETPASAPSPAAPNETAAPVTPSAPDTPSSVAAPIAAQVPAPPGQALPDTFLGPFWTLVSPAGGSASISNSHLFIGVPGGSNHDPLLSSDQAVRVVQAIGNENFDVAIKIDSPLYATDQSTSQGLMVLSDSQNFTTFSVGNRHQCPHRCQGGRSHFA